MKFETRIYIISEMLKVSGGGNGLGRGLCLKLAQKGCNVAVVDIDLKAAEKTAAEIREKGVQAKAYKADVTKSNEIIKLRIDTQSDLGPVDILVSFNSNIRIDACYFYL